jgi:hypothetical protein
MPGPSRQRARAFVALVALLASCSSESEGDARHEAADGGAAGSASAGVAGNRPSRGGSSGSAGSVAGSSGAGAGRGSSNGGEASGGESGSPATPNSGGAADAGDGATAGGAGIAEGGSAGSPDETPEPSGRLTVFYLDVGGSVMATNVQNPRARTIVADAGQGPDGIAIDLEQGHIYWTGMGVPADDDGFVLRSDLDGSNIVTIVPAGGTYTPKQLKLDHENGKLYWSDREGMRVMRSNLDGAELETLVTVGEGAADRRDNSRWCVGIALDVAGGFVYWSQKGADNAGVGSLRRAHIELPAGEDSTNRSDIEVLFDGLPEPIDIDLDLANGRIYWTDRGDDTINRAPIEIPEGATAENRRDREILIEGVREAIGVTLDLERGKLYFTGGTLGRVGMANLDGSEQRDLLSGDAGLTGIAVVELPLTASAPANAP